MIDDCDVRDEIARASREADQRAFGLAIAKNAATNGRLFIAMLFIVSIAAFITGRGEGFGTIATLCSVPVGLAYLSDAVARGGLRLVLSFFIMITSAALAVAILINLG